MDYICINSDDDENVFFIFTRSYFCAINYYHLYTFQSVTLRK